ncbi:MAG: ABC transporter ATP-binding protein [Proteobacteria bacterium]|nr:ABC transporter ATP-binding protein [Pseudomonadota bacterium]
MDSILRVQNLYVKKSSKIIIDIPDLSLSEGTITSIIGENGAGKTTLILTLAGLLRPTNGEIYFYQKKIGTELSLKKYRQNIAIVFQENMLINDTVYENIALGLKFRKMNKLIIKEKVKKMLEIFKISHLRDRKAHTLSGGEAKRVSIARALVLEPDILFLDEPFTSLDSISKEEIISDMIEILRKKKVTTILSTHDKFEAFRLSDLIIVMESGKIIQKGNKEDIIKHPANSFVASFIGAENILEGIVIAKKDGGFIAKVHDKLLECVGSYEIGDKVLLCIRPENIFISKHTLAEEISTRNLFEGKIKEIINFGHFYRITIDTGFNLIAYITKTSIDKLSLKIGDDVITGFKATSIHTISKV